MDKATKYINANEAYNLYLSVYTEEFQLKAVMDFIMEKIKHEASAGYCEAKVYEKDFEPGFRGFDWEKIYPQVVERLMKLGYNVYRNYSEFRSAMYYDISWNLSWKI